MRTKKLCVGMVGAGSWARRHLEVWGKTDGTQVVAIYNRTMSNENDDECIFLATFENGVHGFLRTSRIHDDRSLRACGSQGVVMLEGREGKLLGKRHSETGFSEIPVTQSTVPTTMVTQFVSNIRNDTDLSPTFYDGMKAQEVMDAVLQSAEEQRWVSLSASHKKGE